MRKLILQEFVSLDGLAAGPNDSVDFVPASTQGDETFGAEQLALMDTIDAILLGRVTYEMFAGHWPNVTEGRDKPFADKLNAIPKVVFSRRLGRAPWGRFADARVVEAKAEDEVPRLKRQAGKDMIVWGSLSLAHALMAADLVDEYRLVVCPLVLGEGRPLFGRSPTRTMQLVGARAMDRGAASLRYVPARAVGRVRDGAAGGRVWPARTG